MLRLTRLLSSRVLTQQPARNLVSFSKQPTKVFTRSVHAAPREYNSLQSAAHHFKQQRHMPYFLEYLMWVVFGSEALHLIWLKMDYKEYRERTAHKTKLLEELIERIENGEAINDSLRQEIKMVLLNNKLQHKDSNESEDIDDDYLNHCK
ncbi:uncharacterized protein B0P05DRAFT_548049 [Gilbertella persicaria]|uniref:uncharacterized protein n=1 Tax=Gilbertella persicaria TaxID=101096 RepID=UPI00221FFD94|nr:uncharacterized protein B0P05DRAFT_548049 [Gilbertella persicaria]KAI8074305.1 hypothetical protein B0P05DRAFT_548049 [Gilbertella persicaria]